MAVYKITGRRTGTTPDEETVRMLAELLHRSARRGNWGDVLEKAEYLTKIIEFIGEPEPVKPFKSIMPDYSRGRSLLDGTDSRTESDFEKAAKKAIAKGHKSAQDDYDAAADGVEKELNALRMKFPTAVPMESVEPMEDKIYRSLRTQVGGEPANYPVSGFIAASDGPQPLQYDLMLPILQGDEFCRAVESFKEGNYGRLFLQDLKQIGDVNTFCIQLENEVIVINREVMDALRSGMSAAELLEKQPGAFLVYQMQPQTNEGKENPARAAIELQMKAQGAGKNTEYEQAAGRPGRKKTRTYTNAELKENGAITKAVKEGDYTKAAELRNKAIERANGPGKAYDKAMPKKARKNGLK